MVLSDLDDIDVWSSTLLYLQHGCLLVSRSHTQVYENRRQPPLSTQRQAEVSRAQAAKQPGGERAHLMS